MGWLRFVGSWKVQVPFAEYSLFYDALLQKRPIIFRSLLIVATLYDKDHTCSTNCVREKGGEIGGQNFESWLHSRPAKNQYPPKSTYHPPRERKNFIPKKKEFHKKMSCTALFIRKWRQNTRPEGSRILSKKRRKRKRALNIREKRPTHPQMMCTHEKGHNIHLQSRNCWAWRFHSTKPHTSVKEPYIAIKEPYLCTAPAWRAENHPYVSVKETVISFKEPYVSIKHATWRIHSTRLEGRIKGEFGGEQEVAERVERVEHT